MNCAKDYGVVDNSASHGYCKRHYIAMMSFIKGKEAAIADANEREAQNPGQFCEDLSLAYGQREGPTR